MKLVNRTHAEDAPRREREPRMSAAQRRQQGAIGWILLWVIGIPIPILLLFFLIRGCT